MQPLETKKISNLLGQTNITQSLATKKVAQSRGTKISRNFLGQKFTQPLGTKKDHVISWDKKKSHNLSGQKKLPNFSEQKESRNLLRQKTYKLSRQKNHATS